jgi:hypothetical protein
MFSLSGEITEAAEESTPTPQIENVTRSDLRAFSYLEADRSRLRRFSLLPLWLHVRSLG